MADLHAIEIIRALPRGLNIRHAVFDHDGTITTLRQGWEAIMEPVMVRAVLGERYGEDPELAERVTQRIRKLIEETTGIQTLVQMRSLVEMVREIGRIPTTQILDEHGYKAIYKAELDTLVARRIAEVRQRQRAMNDILVPGVLDFLRHLRERRLRLYLCSGSDQADITADAELLDLTQYFGGGIHGAVGDVHAEAKRIILDRIIDQTAREGGHVVTFGDGPVEMRETRKRGGIAIGLATDETDLGRLCPVKRERLIRAGADIIIPDYTDNGTLLRLLGIEAPYRGRAQ